MNETERLQAQFDLFARTPSSETARARLLDLVEDAVGVGVAGASTTVARRCLPALQPGDPATTAWMRGVCMHALDFDDTHEPSLCHTGTAIVPALLALAQGHLVSGAQLLDAFEVGLRFVEFLAPFGPRVNSMGLHSTGILGTLGSAAAGAWLLTGEPARAARAVEIASLMTGGLGVAFGNDGKSIQAGRAADAGIRAALLAAAAVEGPTGGVLGPRGIFALWLGEDAPAQARWGDPCAQAAENVAIKPYPSCFLTHSTIDAALELRKQLGVREADAVARFEVTVHPIARDLADKTVLESANDAKFSLRYCVLASLAGEVPAVPTFGLESQARLTRSADRWRDWVDRCEVRVDETSARLAATAGLVTAEGRTAQVTIPHPSGSVSSPLDRKAVEAKFRANLTTSGVDADAALAELASLPGSAEVSCAGALAVPWTLGRSRSIAGQAR